MRILILNRVEPPAPGATGRLVKELAKHLQSSGHTVQTITAGKMPPRLIPYLAAFFSIGLRAMLAPRADRVVVMTDPPMLQLWIPLLKLRHVQVIFWCQDMYPNLFPVIGLRLPRVVQTLLMQMHRLALHRADRIIVIGRCMQDILAPMLKPNQPIHVLPNWTEQQAPPALPPARVLKVLYAGNIGRVHPVSAIAQAVQSAAHLPIKFLFMTSGHGEAMLKQSLGNQSNVYFMPPQDWEAAATIQGRAHLHWVGLSRVATGLAVPVKYYAALRCGRPVVFMGERDSEIAMHIQEHGTGTLMSEDNTESFVSLLSRYVDAEGKPTPHWHEQCQNAENADRASSNRMQRMADLILCPVASAANKNILAESLNESALETLGLAA